MQNRTSIANLNTDFLVYSSSYGALLPGRHGSSESSYMYGFQGQEKDNEIKNIEGSSISYEFRMHDPRIGRFFAVDPLAAKYPYYTPYSFSGNEVIAKIELEGLEPTGIKHAKNRSHIRVRRDFSGTGWLGKIFGLQRGKYLKNTNYPGKINGGGAEANTKIARPDEIPTKVPETGNPTPPDPRKEQEEKIRDRNKPKKEKVSPPIPHEISFDIPFQTASDEISNEDVIKEIQELLGSGENEILSIEIVTSTMDPKRENKDFNKQSDGIIVQGKDVRTTNSTDLLDARAKVVGKKLGGAEYKRKNKFESDTSTKVVITYQKKLEKESGGEE